MPFRYTDWEPKLTGQKYKGHETYDHNVAPNQVHDEDEDEEETPEISFDWDELDTIVEPDD